MSRVLLMVLLAGTVGCGKKDIEGDKPGECTDKADNDADGKFDCDDSDCKGSPDCKETATDKRTKSRSAKKQYSSRGSRNDLSFSCDEQTILAMTPRERVLARNEPYARHGRPFKTAWIRCHFLAQSWYEPTGYYDDSDLSSSDKKCVSRIKKIEKTFGKYDHKSYESSRCHLD